MDNKRQSSSREFSMMRFTYARGAFRVRALSGAGKWLISGNSTMCCSTEPITTRARTFNTAARSESNEHAAFHARLPDSTTQRQEWFNLARASCAHSINKSYLWRNAEPSDLNLTSHSTCITSAVQSYEQKAVR